MSGIVFIAYGDRARLQAGYSIAALRKAGERREIVVIGDEIVKGARYIPLARADNGGRLAKLHLDTLTPWPAFCYLDADTRPRTTLDAGFAILADGFDLVICPSGQQGADFLWRCGEGEREATADRYETAQVLSLQGGVWWARQSPQLTEFFAAWRAEWGLYQDQDQGALLRALYQVPLRIWLLGPDWNGGRLIQHLHGQAREGV